MTRKWSKKCIFTPYIHNSRYLLAATWWGGPGERTAPADRMLSLGANPESPVEEGGVCRADIGRASALPSGRTPLAYSGYARLFSLFDLVKVATTPVSTDSSPPQRRRSRLRSHGLEVLLDGDLGSHITALCGLGFGQTASCSAPSGL